MKTLPSIHANEEVSIQEAAEILKVSTKTLRRWEEQGLLIPARTLGGHRRYKLFDLNQFKKPVRKFAVTQSISPEVQSTVYSNETTSTSDKYQSHPSHLRRDFRLGQFNPRVVQPAEKAPPIITANRVPSRQENFFSDLQEKEPRLPELPIISRKFALALVTFILIVIIGQIFPKLPQISFQGLRTFLAGYDEKKLAEIAENDLPAVLADTTFTENIRFQVNTPATFSGNVTVNENLTVNQTIAVNSGTVTTTSDTVNLFTENAATLNFGLAADTLSIGGTTGTTTVNNSLNVTGLTNDIAGTLNLSGNILASTADLTIDPTGGGVKIGTGTPGSVDLTGDDLYITGDVEIDGTLYGVNANISGTATISTLSINSDSFTDLTGTGLQISSSSLQTTLGTAIDSSEITDDTIVEVDLKASNAATADYLLTYNSSTGGFTWVSPSTQRGIDTVQESDVTVNNNIATTLDFLGGDFDISESPDGEVNIQLATTLTSPTAVAGNFDVAGTLASGTSNAFQVSAAGTITLASGQTLTIGTTSLNESTAANDSGASLVGVFPEFANSSSTNVQDVLDDLDAAIGGGGSKWTQQTGFAYLTSITDDLVVGASTVAAASFYIDESAANLYLGTNESQNGILTLYSSGAGITDASLTTDASGNLLIDSANFDVTTTGINATAIGATTRAAGNFTTLAANSTVTFSGLTTDGPVYTSSGVLATEATLALSRGGTAKAITASNGQVVYSDADSFELTTGGTTNYCLKYQSGSAPSWNECVTSDQVPLQSSGGVITKLTAGDYLSLRYGDAADTQLEIQNTTSGTIPTADAVAINLTGGTTGIITDGADGLYIAAEFGDEGINQVNSLLHLDVDPVAIATSDDTFYALNIDGLTGTSATETAINIGSGWDTDINFADTSPTLVIANTGTLTVTDGTNTLFSIADDTSEGDVTVTGDLAVNGATSADITSSTTTASIFNSTVTSLNIGGAATTLNLADAAVTGTIDIGGVSADGATTVNIATQSTSADTITIGNSNSSTTLALTGGDDWNLTGTGILTLSASSSQTTALLITDTDYTNALSIADNNIIGTTAAINFDDFDVDSDGLMTFTSDGTGDQISITTPAADFQALVVDATTNDSTQTAGIIDLNVDSSTNGAVLGQYLTATAIDDDAADTLYGNRTDITVQDDITASDTFYGNYIDITQNDTTPATVYGLAIIGNDNGTSPITAGLLIDNQQATDIDMTDGIVIQATTNDSIVDGIDVSDGELTNAINIGANAIAGTNFSVTAAGTITIASSQTLTIGTTSLNETTGATDTGAVLVGVYNGTLANASSATNVQEALDAFDNAIGAGSSKWTINTTPIPDVLYPTQSDTTSGNDLAIGGTTITAAPFAVDVSTNTIYVGDAATAGNTNVIFKSNSGGSTGTLVYNTSDQFEFSGGGVLIDDHLTLSADVNEGVSGGGLTDCDDATQKLAWDATTNKFSCGTDGGAGSGSSKWTDNGTITYLTATTDDLIVGSDDVDTVAPFYIDVSANTVRIGDATVAGNAILSLYANGGATGNLTYNSSDQFQFSAGDVLLDQDLLLTSATPTITLTDSDASSDDYSFNVNANVLTLVNDTDSRTEISFAGDGGIDFGDNTATKTIDVGGVTASAADTINLATNSTAADVITIGNSNAATTVAITGGTAWSISTVGALDLNGQFDLGDGGDSGAIDTNDWDITTGGNMSGIGSITADGAISFTPSSTSDIVFTQDADTNFQIASTIASDVSLNVADVTLTASGTGATGTLNGLAITNADAAGTTTPDSLVYLAQSDTDETVTNGIFIENTAGGTLTNGIQIKETAGTIGDAILISGTLGNILNTDSIDISGGGAISGATGISSSGTIAFSGLSTDGVVYTSGGTGTLNSEAQLALARGGTNKNITASAGSVVYSDTDSFELTVVGVSGQCLTSNGTSAPSWTSCDNAATTPFTVSAGIIDKTTAGDRLRLLYGDAADVQLTIENTTNGTIPTADGMQIDLTGGTTGIVADGADGLYIATEFGDGISSTRAGLHLNIDPVDTPTSDDTFYAINIDGLTADASVENAINIGAGWDRGLVIDAATTDSSLAGATSGIIQLSVDANPAATSTNQALYLDYETIDDANADQTFRAARIDFLNSSEDAADTTYALSLSNTNNASVTAVALDALIHLDNADVTAASLTDGIVITSSGVDSGITDAIDVSAANLNNGINFGANFALFDGVRQFSPSSGTWTLEDTSGNDLLSAVDAGAITIGSSAVGTTGITLATDGTGDAEVTLPTGSISGTEILDDTVALTTDTSGNYVATITAGNGISGASATEGGTPTIALSSLTSNWSQTGAFDIVLNNASSELSLRSGDGAAFFGTLDVATLAQDVTYTLPDPSQATATICLSTGNCSGGGAAVNGSGAADRVAYWSDADTITYSNNFAFDVDATTQNLLALASTTLTTGNVFDITATYVDATGGTDSAIDINLTNTPSASANTLRAIDVGFTDAGSLANTVYGLYVDATTANSSDTTYAAAFTGGNVGIGDTTPSSQLEVGDGTDSLQISSVGDITFVDANGAATITGPSGGALNIASANSQNLALSTTTAGDITLTPAAASGLVNILTGNLKVGNGTPDVSQAGGETAYIESTLEVDGAVRFDTSLDMNGAIDLDSTSATAFTLGDGTNNYVTFDGSTDAGDTLFDITGASSGITSGKIFNITADTITTGTAFDISADGLTSGRAFRIESTTADTTAITDGLLGYFNWDPTSTTTKSGDLFRINIASDANVTNLFNVTDAGSSLFRVGESQIESAVPHTFTAPGDTSFSYDAIFTNQTASQIESYGPLSIVAGESFESNDLTLQVYNGGSVIVDGSTDVNTGISGVLDLNVNSITNNNVGFNVDFTANDGVTAGEDLFAAKINLTQNDADGDLFGMLIDAAATTNAAAGSYEYLLRLNNNETTADSVTDFLLINTASTPDTTASDAIDVSDSDLFNAINVGTNFILGDGIRQFSPSSTVWTFEDTDANDLITITDAGTTGNVVITGTGSINGNSTLGDANTDAITINAGTSGTGITFVDSSFGTCTALETVAGVLTCGSDAAGSATPGGSDTQIQYNDGGAFGGTAAFTFNDLTGELTVTDNFTFTLAETENIAVTNTVTSTNAVDLLALTLTNQSSSGTQRGVVITNADDAANATTETLLTLDSTEATANAVTDYLTITTAATDTTTDAIDVSDAGLFNAINVGDNNIAGTTAVINFDNFDVAADGNITVDPAVGLDTNAAGALEIGDVTATSVTIGTTAATTLDLGAGGALTRAINIGTGTGADTINIGTGGSTADDINIGGLATSTIGVLGVTSIGDGGTTNYAQFNATGDLTFVGSADTITGPSGAALTVTAGASQALTLTGNAASVWSTTAGDLTVDSAAGSLNLTSGENVADSIVISSDAGGIDITTASAEDIDITAAGGLNLTSSEADNAAITLATTNAAGGIDITSSSTTADAIDVALNSLTTNYGFDVDANVLTAGTIFDLSSTSAVITTGTSIANGGTVLGSLLNVSLIGNSAFTGNLSTIDWSPTSATTATGDLFQINIGTNGTTSGKLFTITDAGTNLFSVSESIITSALPHEFTAAGDVTIAYDIQFTNQTSSSIKSKAPLIFDVGESFESNSATFNLYNSGTLIVDGSTDVNTGTSGVLDLNVNSITTGNTGFNVDYVINDGAGTAAELFGAKLNLTQNDADSDLIGFEINAADTTNAAADDYEALLRINGNDTTANAVTDYILITTAATDTTSDAIDVSDAGLFNAINVGDNNIAGTTAVINFDNFDVAADGNITVDPAVGLDTNAAGALEIGDVTATSVTIGTTAATTLDLGAGGALTRAINIGTGTGADTISIGTGATNADTITFGNTGPATTFAFNSGLATGTVLSLATASLTTGEAFDLTATSTPTAGGTQSVVDWNFTNAATTNANTLRGLDIALGDATALANTTYGAYIVNTTSNNAAHITNGLYASGISSSTTADTLFGADFLADHNGAISTGTKNVYGVRGTATTDTPTDTGGTINTYGGYFSATGAAGGTSNAYGLYATATGGDFNYAAGFGNDVLIQKQADSTTAFARLNSAAGTFGSETNVDSAFSLASYNGSLYVGTAEPWDGGTGLAGVYRYDGGATFTSTMFAAGQFVTGGTSAIDEIWTMAVLDGYLYAGTWENNAGNGSAEVYRYDGSTTWAKVSQSTAGTIAASGTASIEAVSAMGVHQGKLYVGTDDAEGTEIYRYNGGTAWTRVSSAAGTIDSGGTAAIQGTRSMASYDGALYIGTFDSNAAEVYRYEGGTNWTRVTSAAGTIVSGGRASIDGILAMATYNGALYIATEEPDAVEIYRYDGAAGTDAAWTQVTAVDGTVCNSVTEDRIESLTVYNGKLYAGLGDMSVANKGEVCRYDGGTTWTLVSNAAGQISSGASTSANTAQSMVAHDGSLFVGSGKEGVTNDVGEVHRYTAVEGQSYALKFNAASDNDGVEQNNFLNLGSISFLGEQQIESGAGINNSGAFLFSHGIATGAGGYDVAEDYPTRDDTLTPGDVVAIDQNEAGFVAKADSSATNRVIGVYSSNPGIRLSQKNETINGARTIPVAMVGRVPVKIDPSSAAIVNGDFIGGSTNAGRAEKITSGFYVGRALESWEPGSNKDQIMIYVTTGYYLGDIANNGQLNSQLTKQDVISLSPEATTNVNELTLLATQVASDSARMANLETSVASMSAQLTKLSQITDASQSAQLLSLLDQALNVLGSATTSAVLQEDLTVLGDTTLSTVFITDELRVGLMKFSDMDSSIDSIAQPLKLQPSGLEGIDILDGTIVIDNQGNITSTKELTVRKLNIGIDPMDSVVATPSASIGEGLLQMDTFSVMIPTTAVTENSKVFVTPRSSTGGQSIIVDEILPGESFSVRIEQSYHQDIKFDWWIVDKVGAAN